VQRLWGIKTKPVKASIHETHEKHEVLAEPSGQMLSLNPIASSGIENELQAYFDDYFTMSLDNIKVNPRMLGSDACPRGETMFERRTP